jgi:hypothetical protein
MTYHANWHVQFHYFKNCSMADIAEMYTAEEMRIISKFFNTKETIYDCVSTEWKAFYVLF